jgi:hypothetical protein
MAANTSFGPINIAQGASAAFVIEFLDAYGNLTVPSSGNLTVTYTNASNASQTDTVMLTLSNSFYTGTWSSTSAAIGVASWTVTSAGSTTTQQAGTLRVVENV